MRLWLLFIGLIFFASCVPNKKIVLLQKDDVNAKGLLKDTVVRTYAVDTFNYKIQPNDLIHVRFHSLTPNEFDFFSPQQPQGNNANLQQGGALFFGELVDENGEISFPVIGKVKVAGLTVFQVQDKLQGIANQYLESPIVKVRLLNFRATVLGEVMEQGTITFTNNRVTLLEAIAMSGGLSEMADRGNIKLVRQKEGYTEVQYIDLLDEEFINSPYYYLYQNDVLIVPPLKQRAFRRYFGMNLSLIVSTISLVLLTVNLTR